MKEHITEFSTFGSCSSRNIFNSKINKDYKKYFKINKSVESCSLISLMSKPMNFDVKLINSSQQYDNICVIDDLTKNFLKFAEKDYVDYIIIDTLFDVASSVILLNKNTFITLNGRLMETELFKDIKNKKTINIFNDFDVYYILWKKACDKFFKFIDNACNHTKIILNCSRQVYKYKDENNNVFENQLFKKTAQKFNPMQDILDKYILENFDVEVLEFNQNTYADKNHIFEFHPNHYETEYYLEKNNQLLNIINRNNKLNYFSEQNHQIRKSQREKVVKSFDLTKISIKNWLNNKEKRKSTKDNIGKKLIKYNTARIDLKNKCFKKNENSLNSIKLTNISDFNLEYRTPEWFKDAQGIGMVIESDANFLKFDAIMNGDGKLNIYIKSMDVRLDGMPVQIYIKYTKFLINGKNILNEDKIVSHNNQYIYSINVKDGQKLSFDIEWVPF